MEKLGTLNMVKSYWHWFCPYVLTVFFLFTFTGHTSTKINDSLVILFGGMTSGGYRGAINLVTVVNMKYNEDCENFVAQVNLTHFHSHTLF